MKLLVVLPAYNEEKIIEATVTKLAQFLDSRFTRVDWCLVVSDNASTDATAEIVQKLSSRDNRIIHFYVARKGKGIAIKQAWLQFPADVSCFMDSDLATDIEALPMLVKEIEKGGDIAIGSRYLEASQVERSFFRRMVSIFYSVFIRAVIGTRIKDLPCGFKAVNQRVISTLLNTTENNTWFFDSELVLRAEAAGYTIKEIAVRWSEKNDHVRSSRVRWWGFLVFLEYMKNAMRLKKQLKRKK